MIAEVNNETPQLPITSHHLELISESIKHQNINNFKQISHSIILNYKSLNKIKHLIAHLPKSSALQWGSKILKDESNIHDVLISNLFFEIAQIWKVDSKYNIHLIHNLSESENWQIRDSAIKLLTKSLMFDENKYLKVFEILIQSPNPFQRRVALSVAKSVTCLTDKHNKLKLDLLKLLLPAVNEKDPFVKSIIPDMFANGYLRHFTKPTIAWIKSNIKHLDNPYSQANLLTVFCHPLPKESVSDALSIVDLFLSVKDESVRCARSSALRNLCKIDEKQTLNWLEKRLDIEEGVQHWAEINLENDIY